MLTFLQIIMTDSSENVINLQRHGFRDNKSDCGTMEIQKGDHIDDFEVFYDEIGVEAIRLTTAKGVQKKLGSSSIRTAKKYTFSYKE